MVGGVQTVHEHNGPSHANGYSTTHENEAMSTEWVSLCYIHMCKLGLVIGTT